MSLHSQRGKVKSASRARSQRMPNNNFPHAKNIPPSNSATSEDEFGIFNNAELTYWLARHAIGNIGEVTTVDREKILGLIRAISPAGDMGLTYAYSAQRTKNGHVHTTNITLPLSDWKIVRIPNIKLTDGLIGDPKVDPESAVDADVDQVTEDKELIPFFESSDAVQDCVLDQGGFPAEEMFKTNKELFSVSSTYNPDLTEYTTAVDRNAPNFSETEARCAQLARDIEGCQGSNISLEEACDDEELAFSAVVRLPKDDGLQSRPVNRKVRNSQERLNVARSLHTKGRISTNITCSLSAKDNIDHPQVISEVAEKVSAVSLPVSSTVNIAVPSSEKPDVSTSVNPPVVESKSTESSQACISIEEKFKKSTLDPNAPEFQPMSMQYSNCTQPHVQHPITVTPLSVHSLITQQGQLPIQTVPTFVATTQPHMYAPASVHYGVHPGPSSHLLSNATNSIQSQIRGGSLPPNIHPQHFPNSMNPQTNFLLQAQPGMSISQFVSTQPPVVAVPNSGSRFSGPSSSVAHVHQRSENGAPSHSTAYGIPQPNMSVSTFQPPVYQIPHSMWLAGHPQMGLQLIPGTAGSPPLMVGNLPMSQPSGQPIYPAQAMLHMQPPQLSLQVQVPQAPSTTHQQSQQQQVFQTSSIPFQDQPHHIQLPAYAANMFSSQATALHNYYSNPMLAGTNASAAAMQQGLFPLVNQNSSQHSVGGIAHPAPSLDPALLNTSVPNQYAQQPNDLLQQFAAVQLIQAQLAAGQHVNTQQHRAYQTIAAMVSNNNNNPSSQPH